MTLRGRRIERCCVRLFGCLLLLSIHSPAGAERLWSANMETGDLEQWPQIWISGPGHAAARIAEEPAEPALSGRYSCALTVDGDAGVRMAVDEIPGRSKLLPDTAYYSVWYYVPQFIEPDDYWNVFQWKRVEAPAGSGLDPPVWSIDIAMRESDGQMHFKLYRHVGYDGEYNTEGHGWAGASPLDVRVGEWVHLEAFYRWSIETTGALRIWQDGEPIIQQLDVITEYDYGYDPDYRKMRQWTVNNYTDGTHPGEQTIYIDDAVVSTRRTRPIVGPIERLERQ